MKSPDKAEDGRAARLAEALRENLRKRKVQARARKQAGADAGAALDADARGPGVRPGRGEGNETGRHGPSLRTRGTDGRRGQAVGQEWTRSGWPAAGR